ncbi:hypothetical protein [Enterococcus gilvus]|jgi:hypothetical protein|uniref:hypothetical protein n=1 Tax=Enterococcus gilvus TaxID=160453 RepID=UPI001F07807E|nr:hypothetical protein [Enterococcus gilvus]
MKRLAIKSLLLIVLLFTAVPAFAADAEYDSNGVTAFYGKYEYPKSPQKKRNPKKRAVLLLFLNRALRNLDIQRRAMPARCLLIKEKERSFQLQGILQMWSPH